METRANFLVNMFTPVLGFVKNEINLFPEITVTLFSNLNQDLYEELSTFHSSIFLDILNFDVKLKGEQCEQTKPTICLTMLMKHC